MNNSPQWIKLHDVPLVYFQALSAIVNAFELSGKSPILCALKFSLYTQGSKQHVSHTNYQFLFKMNTEIFPSNEVLW